MTAQQLRYVIAAAEAGSITEAAKTLYLSQPSLSEAIREVEREAGITIFTRCRMGIAPTKEGVEFLGYARQVVQQMALLEARYTKKTPVGRRFCVSTQHYTFTANAFVEMVKRFGEEKYEFVLNETTTHRIIEDVRNRFSDLGVLYISRDNENVIRRALEDNGLVFTELICARPHVFIRRDHPLADRKSVKLADLAPYPRLSFVQGSYESAYYAEEPLSRAPADKNIRVSDRAAIVNLMIGLNGYTISSGIYAKYLHGDEIVAVPLDEPEEMHIGYIAGRDAPLTELAQSYVQALRDYLKDV